MSSQAAAAPVRVACVGASVTFGLGLPNRRETCYPAVLQRRLDASVGPGRVRVRNFGYSGATVSRTGNEPYWKTPSFTAATRFKPQIVVLMLGTNDAQFANAGAHGSLAEDYRGLIEHFRTLGAKVFASDPPPAFPPVAEIDFAALADVVRPTLRRAAIEADAEIVDFLTPLADARASFPDGLHPTADVAAQLAEIAEAAVRPAIAALTYA